MHVDWIEMADEVYFWDSFQIQRWMTERERPENNGRAVFVEQQYRQLGELPTSSPKSHYV